MPVYTGDTEVTFHASTSAEGSPLTAAGRVTAR